MAESQGHLLVWQYQQPHTVITQSEYPLKVYCCLARQQPLESALMEG